MLLGEVLSTFSCRLVGVSFVLCANLTPTAQDPLPLPQDLSSEHRGSLTCGSAGLTHTCTKHWLVARMPSSADLSLALWTSG